MDTFCFYSMSDFFGRIDGPRAVLNENCCGYSEYDLSGGH